MIDTYGLPWKFEFEVCDTFYTVDFGDMKDGNPVLYARGCEHNAEGHDKTYGWTAEGIAENINDTTWRITAIFEDSANDFPEVEDLI